MVAGGSDHQLVVGGAKDLLLAVVVGGDAGRPLQLRAAGDIDMVSVSQFKAGLRDAVEWAASAVNRCLVIDLSAVDLCGSACLRSLVEAQNDATASGVTLRVVANAPTRRLLGITKLELVLDVYPSVGAALADCV